MKKYLLESSLSEYGLTKEQFNSREQAIATMEGIFGKFGKIVPIYHIFIRDDNNVIPHHIEVALLYKNMFMTPFKMYANSKTYVFSDSLLQYQEQVHHTITFDEAEPNGVGVPTERKLDAWREYLTRKSAFYKERYEKNQAQINDFLSSIREYDERGEVKWRKDRKSGEMIKNGIEYTFSIEYETGHVYEHLKLHYLVSSNLANFIKLSDNSFRATK